MDSDEAAVRKEPVLLAVSVGISDPRKCAQSIGVMETALAEAFPGSRVERVFTSRKIIEKIRRTTGKETETVSQALQRLKEEGVRRVAVQPLHVIAGREYEEMAEQLKSYVNFFDRIVPGRPLLNSEEDCLQLARCLAEETEPLTDARTAAVWMAHGTDHSANGMYARVQQAFFRQGCRRQLVGTLKAEPSLEQVMEKLRELGAERVLLRPMMMAAGAHAEKDMAGENSWRSRLEGAGWSVTCIPEGMGRCPGVLQMLISHARQTLSDAK